jgi:hypothetical protein
MRTKYLILWLFAIYTLTSCSKENGPDLPTIPVERTVFVYMPWSSDLLTYFEINLTDLEASIVENRIQTDRFIVFLAESPAKADLFELKYENGKCTRLPLKSYTDPPFTTADGITSFLNDVVSYSKTDRYAMIIGSHGLGWIPVSATTSRAADFHPHWELGDGLTRYFGGKTAQYQTDITTLAQAIDEAGLRMEYILFDDCYMANIETAYALKGVTDYLIGCPTEVMIYGFPYRLIGEHLTGTVDYEGVVEGFYQFYSKYQYPYGTVAVTDCSELETLAGIMREINRDFSFDESQLGSIQRMDGYTPILFFDLGDYVAKLCNNSALLAEFNAQLERTVPSKRHTPQFYSDISRRVYDIRTYSGITVSDPSRNPATATKNTTAWWQATHD